MIYHNKPTFSEKEMHAVEKVIFSGQIAQGSEVKKLELLLSNFINKKYCAAVSSGTMAISLSLLALKINHKHEVIIPSYTCSSIYHAVKFTGALPVFADIEKSSCNMDPLDIKSKITPKTRAIIFPHMFGQPGKIIEVIKLGIPVIEDIAQSIGAEINHQPTGFFGDIAVTSFYATKMIGAGEGGAVLSNSNKIITKIKDLRSNDECSDLFLRYNAKMTDITASIAIEQLSKIQSLINKRKTIYNLYHNTFQRNIDIPEINSDIHPNYYRCIISNHESDIIKLINFAKKQGIQLRRPVYKPLHLYSKTKGYSNTENAWKRHISIPIYPSLKTSEIDTIIKFIRNYL